jgi:opacity protein-like surface antigen
MKVTVIAAATGAWTLFAAGAALGAPGTYAELDAGALLSGQLHARGTDIVLGPVDLREDHRRGGVFSGLVGRQIGATPVSIEAEALYLNDAIRSEDLNAALGTSAGLRVQSYGATANLKLERALPGAPGGLALSPFAAVGAGYGHADMTILGDHYAGDGFLWQAKAGLSLRTTAALSWTIAYRYVHAPTYNTDKLGLAAKLENHAEGVSIGVRYAFGPRP